VSELDRPGVLASDADRDQNIAVLRDATVEGRLTLEEFSDRVGQAQRARSQDELAALVRDLPAPIPAGVDAASAVRHLALCSRLVRRGRWEIPARSSFRAIFGTIELDLRDARLAASEVTIDVFNLFSTVTVIVPEGVEVTVEGGGWFASEVIEPSGAPPIHAAPTIRLRTSGPGGTLHVRHGEPGQRALRSRDR
jgi:hypothetical protein